MKITFITHYAALYGANRSLLNLIDGLASYGVEPFVIAPERGEITDYLEKRNIPVFVVDFQRWVRYGLRRRGGVNKAIDYFRWKKDIVSSVIRNYKLIPDLAEKVEEWGTDIIYSNSAVINIGLLLSRHVKKPHVWHLREFVDLDYGLSYDFGRDFSIKTINKSDACVAISRAVADYYFLKKTDGIKTIIYNGVLFEKGFDELLERGRQPKKGNDFVFAIVGLIHPAKGQDIALRAFAEVAKRYPMVKLLVIGGGKAAPLVKLADDLGVAEKVEFWGYVSDPFAAYLQADAVLMCSRNEAMGRVTVEANAACRPVIGFDSGGTPELIEHGKTGLLYQGGSESLAACMEQFVADPEQARKMGISAWEVAREKFSVETYTKNFHDVLIQITTDNGIS